MQMAVQNKLQRNASHSTNSVNTQQTSSIKSSECEQ